MFLGGFVISKAMVLSMLFFVFLFPEGNVERENQIQYHQRWTGWDQVFDNTQMVLCESPGRLIQRPFPRVSEGRVG
jgi:hypothetical protein